MWNIESENFQILVLTFYSIMFQNGQTHFKNLEAFVATGENILRKLVLCDHTKHSQRKLVFVISIHSVAKEIISSE